MLICVVLVIAGWLYGNSMVQVVDDVESELVAKGRIIEMVPLSVEEGAIPSGKQWKVTVKVDSGPYEGVNMETVHTYGLNPSYDFMVEVGDKVVLSLEQEEGQLTAVFIADRYRQWSLYSLFALFLLIILAIGRWQGFKTIISLVLTALAIVHILLPGILSGHNPVMVTIITCTGITIITHMLVTGFTRKSLAAILGTFFGIVIGGVTASTVIKLAAVNGLGSEESRLFFIMYGDGQLDITGILFAGIVVGSLGAVMDVAMSIASSIQEIHEVDPGLGKVQLAGRGLNVGRDIIGTMANTLILANTGSALPLMLLITANDIPYLKLVNLDMIASEIIRALSGSIGLFMAVPITALISAALINVNEGVESKYAADLTMELDEENAI